MSAPNVTNRFTRLNALQAASGLSFVQERDSFNALFKTVFKSKKGSKKVSFAPTPLNIPGVDLILRSADIHIEKGIEKGLVCSYTIGHTWCGSDTPVGRPCRLSGPQVNTGYGLTILQKSSFNSL